MHHSRTVYVFQLHGNLLSMCSKPYVIMSNMRTWLQGVSTACSDGVLIPVPTPRTRTPTSDGLSPKYSLQSPVSVISSTDG
jgi:hypothetical protein